MFITNRTFYKELNRVLDLLSKTCDTVFDSELEIANKIQKTDRDIIDVKERVNYTLEKLIELSDRVEALESKRHHKPAKKLTKKTKGK